MQTLTITDISPATLNQLVTVRAGQVLAERLPDLAGLVRVAGHLAEPGRARGAWHYGVRLSDDGGRVIVDMPATLVSSRRLKGGEWVLVTGMIRVRSGQPGTLELRLEASDVETAEAQPDPAGAGGRMTLDAIKRTRILRYPFPVTDRPLRISIIQSSSLQAQVAQDCMAEIEKLGRLAQVKQIPVNMLEPAMIAAAIEQANGDILMLIRGGGDAADFEVFDDQRIVSALAGKRAYRVIGLGHSGNTTLLDLVADYTARTPAQAGMHVREAVEQVLRQWQERKRLKETAQPVRTAFTFARAWKPLAAVLCVGVVIGATLGALLA